MKKKFPSSFYNPITLIGTAVAALSFGLIVFLYLLELFGSDQKPYVGIIAFVVLPAFLILGLILIAIGIIREHNRLKHGVPRERKLPKIDLNDPKQRLSVSVFFFGTILLLLFTAFGSFKAYEYTDSDEFCGTFCHSVMEPEYTAYQFSPHAKVGCVKCHIGPGADWFVRSKLSGAYQFYSVTFNKYPRPIPTPIENLRPARETCEQCHWPKHFYHEKKELNNYFLSNEENSKWTLTLLLKVGGGSQEYGITSGIHWHMNIANEVTYMTTDSARMNIPWVKSKSLNGKETIFRSTDADLSDEDLKKGTYRKMDCMDCHNRPSHIFYPPMQSVNTLLSQNLIDPSVPYIKSVSVEALEGNYNTKGAAARGISEYIKDFYSSNYPKVMENKIDQINNTIDRLQKVYSRNYFPEMKVSWRKFPEQIGHMYSPGCFRCHDGKHVSPEGKVISKDCNVCHTILAQEYEDKTEVVSLKGVEYRHPVDIGDSWKTMICSDCHTREK